MKTQTRYGIILPSMILAMIALLISCAGPGEKSQEKMMENAIEQSSGEETDVDIQGDEVTIESDSYKAQLNTSGESWSDEIPGDVPEFTFGKIAHSVISEVEGAKSYGYFYKDVPKEALEKYDALLKENGFKTVKMTMGEQGTVTGEKGNLIVSMIMSEEGTHVSVQVGQN